MRTAIVTDSTADLDRAWLTAHNVRMVPLTVEWSGATFLDRVDSTPEEFLGQLLASSEMPKTAAPSPGRFAEVYRDLLDTAGYDHILSIHLSGTLSGTVRSAATAARLVDSERITVVDGQAASLGTGLLVWWAVRRTDQGERGDVVAQELRDLVPHLRVLAAPLTLEYLARGGRIGQAARMVGTLLNMKPILALEKGALVPVRKVRGERQIIPAFMQYLEERLPAGGPVLLAVARSQDPLVAHALRDAVHEHYRVIGELQGTIGPVIASHVGPGAYGVVVCALSAEQVDQWDDPTG